MDGLFSGLGEQQEQPDNDAVAQRFLEYLSLEYLSYVVLDKRYKVVLQIALDLYSVY